MPAESRPAQSVPPPVALATLVTGHWITQAIHVAARLGIADLLRQGPRSAEDLAQATGSNARALYRVLRALASEQIFREGSDGCFALTPIAECLQSERPDSMRAWCLSMGADYGFQSWTKLLH